jgi:hypothetical protein
MLRKNSEHTNSSRSINSWCRGARGLHFVNIYGLKPETKNNKRRTVCGSLVAVKPEGHFVRDVLLETSAGSPPAWQLLGTAAEGAVVGEEDRSWRLCRLLRRGDSSCGAVFAKKRGVRGCAGRAVRGRYMRNSAQSKLSGSSRLPACKVSPRRDGLCKVSPEPPQAEENQIAVGELPHRQPLGRSPALDPSPAASWKIPSTGSLIGSLLVDPLHWIPHRQPLGRSPPPDLSYLSGNHLVRPEHQRQSLGHRGNHLCSAVP